MATILRPSAQTFLGMVNRVLEAIGDVTVSSFATSNFSAVQTQNYIKDEIQALGQIQSWSWLRQNDTLTQNVTEALDIFRVANLASIEKLALRQDDGSVTILPPDEEWYVLQQARKQSQESITGIPYVSGAAVTTGQYVYVVVSESQERIYKSTATGTLTTTTPVHTTGTTNNLTWVRYGTLEVDDVRWCFDTVGRIRIRPYPGPLYINRWQVTGYRPIVIPTVTTDVLDIPLDYEKIVFLRVSARMAKDKLDDPESARGFERELDMEMASRDRTDNQPSGVQYMQFSYGGRIFNS